MRTILILLSLIALSVCSNLTYPHYDACDPKWANVSAWTEDFQPHNYTICEVGTVGVALDGNMLTALANFLTAKGLPCGVQRCDPQALNSYFLKNYKKS